MLRKNIYKWHRAASLVIAIPVLLWAVSGFMHPLMTNIKPAVATQVLQPVPVDSTHLKTTLRQALRSNNITALHTMRLVHIDTNWFYQVQLKADSVPVYLSTQNGKRLRNGDVLYAQYIAKQFLEGQPKLAPRKTQYASLGDDKGDHEMSGHDMSSMKDHDMPSEEEESGGASAHDCCDAATACVLLDNKGSRAGTPVLIRGFDEEYKYVNRLLPVYKVPFSRADGVRIYVETTQDRFAFAMDDRRAVFDKLFGLFHTWQWMDAAGDFKHVLMVLITSLAFLTTLMGLYIFFTTKTKKGDNPLVKARRNHRYVSLAASLFTLLFTFSGGFHAFEKIGAPEEKHVFVPNTFTSGELDLNFASLQSAAGAAPITNIATVKIGEQFFWQVNMLDSKKPFYINDKGIVRDGEEQYARYLAAQFKANNVAPASITKVVKFESEYGFINKRLPVWKVSYANERYYVETSTGSLAAHVQDKDLYEGYSFALLHKHHFMDWGGKEVRDISTMFWAAMQVLMVVVGLILYFKWRMKRNLKTK